MEAFQLSYQCIRLPLTQRCLRRAMAVRSTARAHSQGEKGVTLCPLAPIKQLHPSRFHSPKDPKRPAFVRPPTSQMRLCSKFAPGQRATGTDRRLGQVTHPDEIAHGRLHRGHRRRQLRDGLPVNFPLFVHDHQVGYLLGHRLQDTFDRFSVEHRHGDCGRALSESLKKTNRPSGLRKELRGCGWRPRKPSFSGIVSPSRRGLLNYSRRAINALKSQGEREQPGRHRLPPPDQSVDARSWCLASDWIAGLPLCLGLILPFQSRLASLLETRVLRKLRNIFSCPKKGNTCVLFAGTRLHHQQGFVHFQLRDRS